MRELIIIDGYNFIYSHPDYKGLKNFGLELARAKLLEDLVDYRAFLGHDVLVVFDAARVDFSRQKKDKILGVDVVFTAKGETADSAIEKLVFKMTDRRILTVVTSDYLEQKIVFGKGVLRKTPRELIQEMKAARKQMEEHFLDAVWKDNI